MYMNDEIEEHREPQRIPTTQQRVATYRAKNKTLFQKTIELRLTQDECAILDALASNEGMSRILFASLILKKTIIKSGYFLSGGKLIAPTHGF